MEKSVTLLMEISPNSMAISPKLFLFISHQNLYYHNQFHGTRKKLSPESNYKLILYCYFRKSPICGNNIVVRLSTWLSNFFVYLLVSFDSSTMIAKIPQFTNHNEY